VSPSEATNLYLAGVRKLAALEAAGEGETAAADAIRDEMDAPWRAMDGDGRARAAAYSAGLQRTADADRTPQQPTRPGICEA
jgi:hypothetical protein